MSGRKLEPGNELLRQIRRAKSLDATRYGIGGRLKRKAPAKITLPALERIEKKQLGEKT